MTLQEKINKEPYFKVKNLTDLDDVEYSLQEVRKLIAEYGYTPKLNAILTRIRNKKSKLSNNIKYKDGGQLNEEAQQLIDIIDINPSNERYAKYKSVLKEKYNIDYVEPSVRYKKENDLLEKYFGIKKVKTNKGLDISIHLFKTPNLDKSITLDVFDDSLNNIASAGVGIDLQSKTIRVGGVMVKDNMQRKGVYSSMMNEIEKISKENNLKMQETGRSQDAQNFWKSRNNPDIRYANGGSIDKNCIDYIKKTESILKNGYYHCFGSLCFITYNSGNQKDLNVYQTVNLLLSKSLSELLKIDEESASNLISNYYDNARRFDTLNIIKELKGCNIIIADRHKIVCANNIDNVATRYKKVGNMETEYKVIFESRSGSGNVREVRVSASSFNDAKKKGWIKSGLNKKFYAFLTAHEIKAVGGIMASMQVLSTGYTLHNNVQPYKYTIGGL